MAEQVLRGRRSADSSSHTGAVGQTGLWTRRLSLVLAGTLFPLLLLELLFRLAGAFLPGNYQTTSFLESHPEFARRNRPGEGWIRTSEFTSWVEINSKGLRGPETEYEKPPGEVRVLALGDSFTFAEQVNLQETYVHQLEVNLNGAGALRHFRVLNGGSNSWSTANQFVFLIEEGLKYEPDVVLIAFFTGNDAEENYRRVTGVRRAEEADLVLRGEDSFQGPRKVLRASRLYTVFESGVLAKLPWATESDAAVRPPPRTRGQAEIAWNITNSLLERIHRVTQERGIGFAIMMIPRGAQVGAWASRSTTASDARDNEGSLTGFEDVQAILSETGNRLGVPTLDLLPSFLEEKDRSPGEVLYYPVNRHWSPRSHAIAAEQLHLFLIRTGLVAVS
jgi:lysophospholipase L1-like esterase